MKIILITIIALTAFTIAKAQTTDTAKQNQQGNATQHRMDSLRNEPFDQKIFTWVENMPVFPGGELGFHKYFEENLKYPDKARDQNIKGKVRVNFVIEKDGSLTNIKIWKSLSPETDAEAMRVLNNCPKWIPGKQNGRLVRVAYSLQIPFPLSDEQ